MALSKLDIQEKTIKYIKGKRDTSFACLSCLGAEDWNIILDKSGDRLNHVETTVVRDLAKYHTSHMKEKHERYIYYEKFDTYEFINFLSDANQSGDGSSIRNVVIGNSNQYRSSAVTHQSKNSKRDLMLELYPMDTTERVHSPE